MSLHDEAVEAATDRYYRVQSPSPERCMDGAIRAYLAHMAAAGWKLTPREATVRMGDLGGEAIMTEYGANKTWETATDMAENLSPDAIWSAMHDAAPSPEEAP